MAEEYILMGILTRPHGIKGEMCVDWYAEMPLRPNAYSFYLQSAQEAPRPVRILSARQHKERPLVLLEGVPSRTEAELLRGLKILVRKQEMPDLDEGEAYLHDLLGCRILLEDGTYLGILEYVEFPAGQEIWTIRTPDDREILFPAVEEFIHSFDEDTAEVRICPPPGLLDVYLDEKE